MFSVVLFRKRHCEKLLTIDLEEVKKTTDPKATFQSQGNIHGDTLSRHLVLWFTLS